MFKGEIFASLPLLQPLPPSREFFAEEFGGAGAEEVVGDFVFGGHLILFSIQPLPGRHDADREALLFELIFLIEREDE